MALDNYRDLSQAGTDVNAGFQFEFYCNNCSRKWKSPFKPYRLGQITGLLTRFTFLFAGGRDVGRATGNFADIGSRGAKEKALGEAMVHAQTLYTLCEKCNKAVCADCWNPRENSCEACAGKQLEALETANRKAKDRDAEAGATACPNCRAPNAGGRFCAECGFDMASTHKSCPACGTMLLRQARFCTDCGHGF